MMSRCIEILLFRETICNLNTSDPAILNRKISATYWYKLYELIKHRSGDDILKHIFTEAQSLEVFRQLSEQNLIRKIVKQFILENAGLDVHLPDELLNDGNVLFSLGSIYKHRLFKICKIFTQYWGVDEKEPIIRLICTFFWTFYIISYKKMIVSSDAFKKQRPDHQFGIFGFLLEDYKNFNGLVDRSNRQGISIESLRELLAL